MATRHDYWVLSWELVWKEMREKQWDWCVGNWLSLSFFVSCCQMHTRKAFYFSLLLSQPLCPGIPAERLPRILHFAPQSLPLLDWSCFFAGMIAICPLARIRVLFDWPVESEKDSERRRLFARTGGGNGSTLSMARSVYSSIPSSISFTFPTYS